MTRKLLFVVLSLALLVGGVAVGIHILHKQALADVTYIVEIWDDSQDPGEWLEDGTVQFSFDEGVWEDAVWVGDGKYTFGRGDYADSWLIRLVEPDIEEPNPIQGSATSGYQYWEVVKL